MAQTVKSLPAAQDAGSIHGSGRSPGERNGNPLQSGEFLPGEFHGQKSLAGYSPKCCKESDIKIVTISSGLILSFLVLSFLKSLLPDQ